MKINDVIIENEQLDELTAGQVGTAVGKGAGAVAKGVGAVAGGVAGAGKAFMKGFRGGKATVAGDNAESNNPADIQKQIRQKEIELKQLQDKLKTAKTTQAAPTQQPPAAQAAPTQQPPAAQATPAATAAQATTAPQAAPTQQPPAAQAATAPAQGQAAAKPASTPKAGNLNTYFQNFSKEMQGAGDKNQKIALAKELVNIVADRGGEDSATAASILRKVGGDLDNNFKQAAMNALKNGQRLLKQSVYYEITKMLREHNLSWSDLGIRVHLLEGTNSIVGISFK